MRAMEFNVDNRVFSGLLGVIADSLGREPAEAMEKSAASRPSKHQAPDRFNEPGGVAGTLHRLGQWFLRHQADGVGAEIERSRDIFESLDRWLWKQQMRETEAYLAQSKDIFELEARMRRLERGPSHI